jgi:hypothetical protein
MSNGLVKTKTTKRHYLMRNLIFFFLFLCSHTYANDGAYHASGNHLIPIVESSIQVKKEILKLTRVGDYLEVNVYYEFFNPGEAKRVLVGFEAPSPGGDVDGTPVNGAHPYIKDFTVRLNEKPLAHDVAIVADSMYFQYGTIQEKTVKEVVNDPDFDPTYVDFFYVYHFDAMFETGLNKIEHTYRFLLSLSVEEDYSFEYILTAANRWANQQIDDFTLLIDVGALQDFRIGKTFFEGADEWDFDGYTLDNSFYGRPMLRFLSNDGKLRFHKKDFHPEGELFLTAPFKYDELIFRVFDAKEHKLAFSFSRTAKIAESKDELSYKILRNLPYARRGYVFKNSSIRTYYESLDWYVPDPEFSASWEILSPKEQRWMNRLHKME